MHNNTVAMAWLALFTSTDRAMEIEGDLLEQKRGHHPFWFPLQILATSFTLLIHALLKEPLKLLMYGYAVYELIMKLNWWVLNPLRRQVPESLELPMWQMLIVNDAVNLSVAVVLGMLLVKLLPRNGSQVLLIALALLLGRVAVLTSLQFALEIAAFGLVPALLGALLMKRLQLTRPQAPDEWKQVL